MENVINLLLPIANFVNDWIYSSKPYFKKAFTDDMCFLYNSDIIKILYYKMARITTNRDYYLKTLLLDGFKEVDKTDRKDVWYVKTLLSEETAKIKYYKDIPATLFISGEQINYGPVKFLQIGINEDNENHKYKSFAEMLATIRFVIENHVIRYDLLDYDGELRIWLHIDKKTLIPELWIYKFNNKTSSWQYAGILKTFDTGVVLDYIGIDMYNITSKTTVTKIEQIEKVFKKALDDIIYEHLSETPSCPNNKTDFLGVIKDKIYVDDRFSFPLYLSYITLAPLIEYLVKFFEIDLREDIISSQDSIQNYLDAVFEEDCYTPMGQMLTKPWFCDFAVLAKCDYEDVEYNKLNNKKELVDRYVKYENPSELESIYQFAWYLFANDCPNPLIDYIVTKYGSYDKVTTIFNFIKLIYDMLKFDDENTHVNDLLEYLQDATYIKNIYQTIENSSYVIHLIYSKLDPEFFTMFKISYDEFARDVMLNYSTVKETISLDDYITNMIESDIKTYGPYKLSKTNNE